MLSSFSLYFRGSVRYEGRALGLLGPGDFLLLRKNDGSVSIHGGTGIGARNYMGAGTKMQGAITPGEGILSFLRKGETIEVKMDEIHFMEQMLDWSEDEVKLRKTEKELVQKIFWNWPDYVDVQCEIIEMEYHTDVGPFDLIGFATHDIHIIEVKRRKASIPDVTQLKRYVDYMRKRSTVYGYLASPEIGTKALEYLEEHGFHWLYVDFDI